MIRDIFIVNIEAAFDELNGVKGKEARKCKQIVVREVLAASQETLLVIHKKPSLLFQETMTKIKGFYPMILVPEIPENQTMSLTKAVFNSKVILEILFGHIRSGACIRFFYLGPKEQELIEVLKNDMGYNSCHVSQLSRTMNDKAFFKEICGCLNIPTVPGSVTVSGLDRIVETVQSIYEQHNGCMIRESTGAGGLGNVQLINLKDPSLAKQEFLSQISEEKWKNASALVEPFLWDLVGTPTISARLCEKEKVHIIRDCLRFIKEGASTGSVSPSGYGRDVIDQLINYTLIYGRYLSGMGYVGDFDIDFGILKDGSLIAFESNARRQGGSFAHEAKMILHGKLEKEFFVRTNDALKIPDWVKYQHVLDFIKQEGIEWSAQEGGVIVSIEPEHGSFGVWISSRSFDRCMELNQMMEDFASSCYSRKVAPTLRVPAPVWDA